MDNQANSSATFFKRLLLVLILLVSVVLVCYYCSAINTVSRYQINLAAEVGTIFETEDQNTVLVFRSGNQAHLTTDKDEMMGLYSVEQKDNVLLLTMGTESEEEEEIKQVFLSISHEEVFWQNENRLLYRWEEK